MEENERDMISDVLIACSYSVDMQSVHSNRDHLLVYMISGSLDIEAKGERVSVGPGECVFIRRDNRLTLYKHGSVEQPFRCIKLQFTKNVLRELYSKLSHRDFPSDVKRSDRSLVLLQGNRPDVKGLFNSLQPFIESKTRPSDELLKLKLTEGAYVLLNTDTSFYATLFDFTEQWKVNLLDFMNENYMCDLSLDEIASYTGRSLATFKRDFARISSTTPRRWIIRRRLEAARELIRNGNHRVTDVCYSVGFKNLSHFSRVYKATFGVSPACDAGTRRQ